MRKGTLFLSGVLVFVLALASFAFAYENEVKSAAETLAQFMRESGKKTVAVVDFTDLQGNVLELGRFLAEELSISMASFAQKDFKVVDRTHLRALLEEHQLSLSGLIDPATAQKVGEISGVEALVTGTITPFGDNVRLALKVIELATADILGSTSVNIGRTQAINELLSREVTQETSLLVTQETVVGSPSPTPSTSPEMKGVVAKTEGFVFEILNCGFRDGEFWIGLKITNEGSDRSLFLYDCIELSGVVYHTRIVTERGEEYRVYPSKFHLGNSWPKGAYQTFGGIEHHYVSNFLPHGVPIQAWFYFPDVPKETKVISLLEILFSFKKSTPLFDENVTYYSVNIRDIPVNE